MCELELVWILSK